MDGRRLAGAVRPEEAVDLAGLDVQVDPVDRPDVLELANEALDLDSVPAIALTLARWRHIGEPIDRGLATGPAASYT